MSFEGVPEICINGQWMYACSSHWDSIDSTVFCRHFLNKWNVSKYSIEIVTNMIGNTD